MNVRSLVLAILAGGLGAAVVALSVFVLADRLRPSTVAIGPGVTTEIVAMIDGAVATPGLVTLESGARLQDAIYAAGGLTDAADTSGLNLAARVGDGEHVTVPAHEILTNQQDPGATPATGVRLININTATIFELDEIPGVGPTIAQRIVEYRDLHGPFTALDQLAEVEGISPEMVHEIRHLVTIGD